MADTTISMTVDVGTAVEDITSSDAGTASGTGAVDVIIEDSVTKSQLYEALTVIRDAIHREDLAIPNN